MKSPNFVAGSVLMFAVGVILSGTLALMPSMMQDLMNYPVFDAGWMMAPRGVGTVVAMFLVARIVDRVDARLFILVGFLLTAASLWQMTGYSLYMGSGPILFAGLAQGFSLGLTFVPLQLLALSTLPARIMSQGDGDSRSDAHARRQHRHLNPRNPAGSEPRLFIPGWSKGCVPTIPSRKRPTSTRPSA